MHNGVDKLSNRDIEISNRVKKRGVNYTPELKKFMDELKVRDKFFEYNIYFSENLKYKCTRLYIGCYELGPIPNWKTPITFYGFWKKTHITDDMMDAIIDCDFMNGTKKSYICDIYAEQEDFLDNPKDWKIEVIEWLKYKRLEDFKKKFKIKDDSSDEEDEINQSDLCITEGLFNYKINDDSEEEEDESSNKNKIPRKRNINKDLEDITSKLKKYDLNEYVLPKVKVDHNWYNDQERRKKMTQNEKIELLFKNNFIKMKNSDASAYKSICLGYANFCIKNPDDYNTFADTKVCKIENLFENKICNYNFYNKMKYQNKRKELMKCVHYLCDMLKLDPYEVFQWPNIPKIEKFLNCGINIVEDNIIVYKSNKYKWNIYLRYNKDNIYDVYYGLYQNNKQCNDYDLKL